MCAYKDRSSFGYRSTPEQLISMMLVCCKPRPSTAKPTWCDPAVRRRTCLGYPDDGLIRHGGQSSRREGKNDSHRIDGTDSQGCQDRAVAEQWWMRLQIPELVCFPKLAEKLPSVSRPGDFQQRRPGLSGEVQGTYTNLGSPCSQWQAAGCGYLDSGGGQGSQTRRTVETRKWASSDLQGSLLSHSHSPAGQSPFL